MSIQFIIEKCERYLDRPNRKYPISISIFKTEKFQFFVFFSGEKNKFIYNMSLSISAMQFHMIEMDKNNVILRF